MTNGVTRLAPSPTGSLHLGNVRTFLINWALARQRGWRILMRIEDLDAPRVRSGAASQLLAMLSWLGIDHDDHPVCQSSDLEPYRRAMLTLAGRGLAYHCALTRSEIQQAASAPHQGQQELRFPPNLRPAASTQPLEFARHDVNYRFVVPDESIRIEDQVAGLRSFSPFDEVGDFVVWTKLGVPSYQLAVVVDDARQGVTDVVRGDDLLPSAARQTLLYRALNLPAPRWWYVPLVLGSDGRRLAKRQADTRVEIYRRAGVPPQRIIGLLAFWCGAAKKRCEMSADEFRERFQLDTLSRSPVTFTQDDHAWLVQLK